MYCLGKKKDERRLEPLLSVKNVIQTQLIWITIVYSRICCFVEIKVQKI